MTAETRETAMDLEQKIDQLRTDVFRALGEMGKDVKDLTAAMRELVRVDSEIQHLQKDMHRLEANVAGVEGRTQVLEQAVASNKKGLSGLERFAWGVGGPTVGVVLTYVLQAMGAH